MSLYKVHEVELRHNTGDNYWDYDVNDSKKFRAITLYELRRRHIQYVTSNTDMKVCTSLPMRISEFRKWEDVCYEVV